MTTQNKINPVIERFQLNENTLHILKSMKPEFGFNGLGELVFRRTYSRDNEDWADVVKRVIEGCMSIRKNHFIKNSLEWDDNKLQEFAKNMALSLFKMEWLPPGRGLWMMGTEYVYERGSMALYNCFKADTKFWTNEGLKSFQDFQDGDKVIVKGSNKWVDATVKCFGEQELWKLTVQKGSVQDTIYTTKNHRWLAKENEDIDNFEIITTDKLQQNWKLQNILETNNWKVVSTEPTGIKEKVWCVVEPEFEEFTLENGILTKNCAACDTTPDIVHAAEWSMDCLMNGVGVGFNTMWRGEAVQADKEDSEVFIIPDSKEGWVESLVRLLCAYINSPKYGKNKFPNFDYSQIRAKGLPIKGFGGTASGPEPLKDMHKRIEGYLDALCKGRLQCKSKTYKEVNPGDWQQVEVEVDKPYSHTRFIADLFNAIGACVVAG